MKYIFFSVFFFLNTASFAQTLESSITTLANDLASKAIKKHKKNLAVADFTNNTGKSDALTKYITEQIELNLINAEGDLAIMDRKHINQLIVDHNLQSEGLIDEKTAKRAGMFVAVDGWVIGEVTTIGEKIKISVKIIDVTTSTVFAASISNEISDYQTKRIYDAAEAQLAPSDECRTKHTGDICFTNKTNERLNMVFDHTKNITIGIGETQCIHDLDVKEYFYCANCGYVAYVTNPITGRVKIKQCQSQTIVIR